MCFRSEWRGFPVLEKRCNQQKTKEGEDGFHGPSAADPGEKLRKAEVSQCTGQDGTGRQAQSNRHPSQDVVPKQKVSHNRVFFDRNSLNAFANNNCSTESLKYNNSEKF